MLFFVAKQAAEAAEMKKAAEEAEMKKKKAAEEAEMKKKIEAEKKAMEAEAGTNHLSSLFNLTRFFL